MSLLTGNETDQMSTASLSESQLETRATIFRAVIITCCGTLALVAVAVTLRKRCFPKDINQKKLSLKDAGDAFSQTAPQTLGKIDLNMDSMTSDNGSPKGLPKSKTEDELVVAQSEQQTLVQSHGRFLTWRDRALLGLFFLYVACCTLTPYFFFDTLTCEAGFFWETHMLFLCCFAVTKGFELFLYVKDPTLTGELPSRIFLLKFGLSFSSYLDAYQDSVSAAIALRCDTPLAQTLGWSMLVCYVVGVLGLQWGVMGFLCFQDPTKTTFLKLIHLDTVAARLTLPQSQQRTWKILHFVRTVGEDIPQAILQTIYIFSITGNFFMILSVCTAVCGSLMAFWDAINRSLVAAGFQKKEKMLVKAVHFAHGWAIHGLAFEMKNGKVLGNLLANNQAPMDITSWKLRTSEKPNMFQLEDGEYITSVEGYSCRGGYLCYEITFHTNRGNSKTFTAAHEDWRGRAFQYSAAHNHMVVNCKFDFKRGECLGICQADLLGHYVESE